MNISSLFKDKAYSFRESSDNEDEKYFASTVLSKFKPDLKLKKINILGVFDNFDLFSVYDELDQKYTLKISLDDSDKVLKRESTFLKSHKYLNVPLILDYGDIEVGEKVTYLFSKVSEAESIRNYGRSVIFHKLDEFQEAYKNVFFTDKPLRKKYKNVLSDFCKNMSPSKFLTNDGVNYFKAYTDYNLCCEFLEELKSQIQDLSTRVYDDLNHNCHSSLSLDSIFYGPEGFYFDFLHNANLGHPYVDYIDIIMELGVSTDDEKKIFIKICDKMGISFDQYLYDCIFKVQARKKLAELIISYIREVYLYDSFRYERIFYIADTFSHCYKRFCSIDIFKKNREFIMKTICEPIFGVKA